MSSTKRQSLSIEAKRDLCIGCPGGCAQLGLMPAAFDPSLPAPSAAALNAVVGFLFGGPLLLLCAVIVALDRFAPAAHPLLSLSLLLATLVIAGCGIAAQRSKLLHRLQVQPL